MRLQRRLVRNLYGTCTVLVRSPVKYALFDTLKGKQKEQFEAYMTAQREVNVLTDCETFIYAFHFGAKIMMDVLNEGQMKEI